MQVMPPEFVPNFVLKQPMPPPSQNRSAPSSPEIKYKLIAVDKLASGALAEMAANRASRRSSRANTPMSSPSRTTPSSPQKQVRAIGKMVRDLSIGDLPSLGGSRATEDVDTPIYKMRSADPNSEISDLPNSKKPSSAAANANVNTGAGKRSNISIFAKLVDPRAVPVVEMPNERRARRDSDKENTRISDQWNEFWIEMMIESRTPRGSTRKLPNQRDLSLIVS
jgi:hypothetical protein